MKTIHLILNAHLDPAWLWSWRDGLDEVLNTSRYICDLLDQNPDIVYTRGEAWVYQQILKIDPDLFQRIRGHVKASRWSTVGGWYIQPDCNLPSGFAMERQISIGQKIFAEYFGTAPSIGYNVVSFGHAATLPGLMRRAGQHSYVMMRPQEFELKLPARIFRWRGYANGPEVTTFRIAQSYCTQEGMNEGHVRAALTELPPGVNHTMCFIGIGDHGGGPTEEIIDWCRNHRNFEGARLEFSSVDRFFEALKREESELPLVVGELQMHAIGCYSVHRPVKVALREAEHRLVQAEIVAGRLTASQDQNLSVAWERVCFQHFHDTLGGTCIPSAYPDLQAQLGHAVAIADETATFALRKRMLQLCDDPAQRLVFFNASDMDTDDYVEVEPWLEWSKWNPNWCLVDEANQSMEYQAVSPETGADNQVRLLFRLPIKTEELRTIRIVESAPDEIHRPAGEIEATSWSLKAASGTSVELDSRNLRFDGIGELAMPNLISYSDPSDTWSHGIERYEQVDGQRPIWGKPQLVDLGPLRASLIQPGILGQSEFRAEWRVYRDKPWLDCLLHVVWNEKHRVLKLEWNLPADITEREDGIMGGSLLRSMSGREVPVRDWTLLQMTHREQTYHLGVVAPDVFALSCDSRCLGLTLLRAATMAQHVPYPLDHQRGVISDRGEHAFRFRFMIDTHINALSLEQAAIVWHRPLLRAELTRGMKHRALRNNYHPHKLTSC